MSAAVPRVDAGEGVRGGRSWIDLHCHTSASFDSLADPVKVARTAAVRGLTHLVITDHDRIDGALRARDAGVAGVTIIVGEEIRTIDGDLIAAFLERPVLPGMPAAETIEAIREQGGLVGIPHPFDRFRGSLSKRPGLEALASLVDWIEVHNARLVGGGNEQAGAFASAQDRPGVAVSDAHALLEIGVAYTALPGDASTPAGLLATLPAAELIVGRAAYAARLWTPLAKGVQRLRGNRRVRPELRA